jgi:paired amphipathic helix protein Sin3a
MYRCEDERFELDIVIDNIASTVVALEAVQANISKMSLDEANAFQLDSYLGGTSETLQRKSIERIYGDKAVDMIEGLIKKPCVAVPIVLRRLRAKLDEWRDAQKRFNQLWRDQCEKNHFKWLQSQAASFRQLDIRRMRSKTLLNEAETASEELQAFGDCSPGCSMEFIFSDKQDMHDATNLIIHYLSYLPSGQTDDSFRVSQFLLNTLPQFFDLPHPRPDGLHRREDEVYTLMYANSSWYLFLRLYHIFCVRLKDIRRIANGLQDDGHGPQLDSLNGVKSLYELVLNTVRGMVEGTVDVFSYEYELQKFLGTNAYVAYTIEKILQNIVRQLQHLTADEVCKELMELYLNERQRGSSGISFITAYQRPFTELAYRRKVMQLLSDEHCFKIVFYRHECRIVMELIDTAVEMAADEQLMMQYHASNYVELFIDPDQSSCDELDMMKPVFLMRNIQCREPDDVSIIDNIHCQIAPNTFKMSFTANSCSLLYRPRRLCARQCKRSLLSIKRRKFSRWWRCWQAQHISSDQDQRGQEFKSSRTLCATRTRGREK